MKAEKDRYSILHYDQRKTGACKRDTCKLLKCIYAADAEMRLLQ
jgi:hypothetical protein